MMQTHTPSVRRRALTLGALGVVYGDIGTSPLYAFRESLAAAGKGGAPAPEAVLGLLSLILWALALTVTLKYVVMMLRADNQGEGGILSLMTLAQRSYNVPRAWILALGMVGCALFYGDAMITPAISVLSAVEGVRLITGEATPHIPAIALGILAALFLLQRRGTQKVAMLFGPLMALWFAVLALGGMRHIADHPAVWRALDPTYGLRFLSHDGMAGIIALGAVFLAVTGAEALYADLGHFGRRPIRRAWFFVAMPALVLNYAGQAALVLAQPEAAAEPFFLLYPHALLPAMVALATAATVIASQAVITGAFSLTHQAIQLGLLPRLHVQYTSREQLGQIYMPQVNWLLLAGVAGLVLLFQTSGALAAAYGISVTGTMVITAVLAFVVARRVWHWPLALAGLLIAPLLLADVAFFGANLTKLLEGGFVPVLMSALLVLMMRTWVRGSHSLNEQMYHDHTTMEALLKRIRHEPVKRVDGAAVYLTASTQYAPSALLHNLKHNGVLHARNFLLTLVFEQRPYVPDAERVRVEPVAADFTRVFMAFGYMEPPNVTHGLLLLRERGVELPLMSTSFFISRRNVVPSARFGMPLWRDRIYIAMTNYASDAVEYFHLPRSRVVELGVQMTV
jgi:KUP system potassium uptake protein